MFAIYLNDKKKNIFYLIRDRFGIKPLYYSKINSESDVIFASEIQSLHEYNDIKKEINYEQIYYYLNFSQVNSNNKTCFKNINQIPPGSFMEIKPNNIQIKRYYFLENNIDENKDENCEISFKDYLGRINQKFEESFNQHSRFDVEGGIHLSSGSDSAILALLAKKFQKNMNCYTFGYHEKKFSEIEDAKTISLNSSLKHNISILQAKEVPKLLSDTLTVEYEPFSSMRILSQHKLYKDYKKRGKSYF